MQIVIPSPLTTNWLIAGIVINISAHMMYGSEPAMTRAMQKTHQWPTLLLTFAIHFLALLFYSPRLIQRGLSFLISCFHGKRDQGLLNAAEEGTTPNVDVDISETSPFDEDDGQDLVDDEIQQHVTGTVRKVRNPAIRMLETIRDAILGNWLLITYVLLVSFRRMTNIYTPKLISAFYVQLVTLLNPFMVSILSVILIREKFTYHTVVAMFFTMIGGVLVITGNSNTSTTFSWVIDFSAIGSDLQFSDLYGISIALLSTVAMSLSFILVKSVGSLSKTEADSSSSLSWRKRFIRKYSRTYGAETLFIAQIVGVMFISLTGSLITGEEWSLILETKWQGWALLISLGIIFAAGSWFNIYMIWILGATNATTTIPLRLISTLLVSGILLNEWLYNIAQVLGGVIVFVSVTWYLLMLRKVHQDEQRKSQQRQSQEIGVQCDKISDEQTERDTQYTENRNEVELDIL